MSSYLIDPYGDGGGRSAYDYAATSASEVTDHRGGMGMDGRDGLGMSPATGLLAMMGPASNAASARGLSSSRPESLHASRAGSRAGSPGRYGYSGTGPSSAWSDFGGREAPLSREPPLSRDPPYGRDALAGRGGEEVSLEGLQMQLRNVQDALARQIERDRKDRLSEVEKLRLEINNHQVILAEIGEQLLSGGSFDTAIQDLRHRQANLQEELRGTVAELQNEQDVQSAALREGLIEIQNLKNEVLNSSRGTTAAGGCSALSGLSNGSAPRGYVDDQHQELEAKFMSALQEALSEMAVQKAAEASQQRDADIQESRALLEHALAERCDELANQSHDRLVELLHQLQEEQRAGLAQELAELGAAVDRMPAARETVADPAQERRLEEVSQILGAQERRLEELGAAVDSERTARTGAIKDLRVQAERAQTEYSGFAPKATALEQSLERLTLVAETTRQDLVRIEGDLGRLRSETQGAEHRSGESLAELRASVALKSDVDRLEDEVAQVKAEVRSASEAIAARQAEAADAVEAARAAGAAEALTKQGSEAAPAAEALAEAWEAVRRVEGRLEETRMQTQQAEDRLGRDLSARTSDLQRQVEALAQRTQSQEEGYDAELRRLGEELKQVAELRGQVRDEAAKARTQEAALASEVARLEAVFGEGARTSERQFAELAERLSHGNVTANGTGKEHGTDATAGADPVSPRKVLPHIDVDSVLHVLATRAEQAVEERLARELPAMMAKTQSDVDGEHVKAIFSAELTRLEQEIHSNRATLEGLVNVVDHLTKEGPTPGGCAAQPTSELMSPPFSQRSLSVPRGSSHADAGDGLQPSRPPPTAFRGLHLSSAKDEADTPRTERTAPPSPARSAQGSAPAAAALQPSTAAAFAEASSSLAPATLQAPAVVASASAPAPAGGQLQARTLRAVTSPSTTARNSVHSVPAALHGLVDAARVLPGPTSGSSAVRRRALLIGCGYGSSHAPLAGSVNDTWNMMSLFRHTLQYSEEQVKLLLDGSETCPTSPSQQPTRENILAGLEWLVQNALPGDEIFLYFSGYSTQQPACTDANLYQPYMVPVDFAESLSPSSRSHLGGKASPGPMQGSYRLVSMAEVVGYLARLPPLCRAMVVLDCALGMLPGVASEGSSRGAVPAASARVLMKPVAAISGKAHGRPRYLNLPPIAPAPEMVAAASSCPVLGPNSCPIYVFSAGQLAQQCSEVSIEGVVQGAFTWAWTKALIASHLRPTVHQQCESLRAIMANLRSHNGWIDQEPMLSMTQSARPQDGLLRGDDSSETIEPKWIPQRPLPTNHRRRKALLVGVNYVGSHAPLKGCVNDAWNIHSLLRHTLQFGEEQIRMLVDGDDGQSEGGTLKQQQAPTKANIQNGMHWLFGDAQPGDQLLLLFCGYGAQQPAAQQPPQPAGAAAPLGKALQEAFLVPGDFAADLPMDFSFDSSASTAALPSGAARPRPGAGYRLIPLTEVTTRLVRLPAGVRVTLLMDCSHSLVPNLSPSGASPTTFAKVERGRVNYNKLRDFVTRPRFLELPPLPPPPLGSLAAAGPRPGQFPECQVHCLCACRNSQWDAELPLEGTVQGAFTWAFVKAFAAGNFHCTLQSLQRQLESITADLKNHFKGVEQTPVLQLSRATSGQDYVLGA
eukprot:TRINITY_DN25697_c0_g3_i1.p1 TRINITY_DN25697_c0_g3~~TRINITY_DN25697_c0_g3_i1.p1  ORF type:complete len:1640 (+),score=384.46 TRINITY_DN25697_c0_g3_i1:133-5052(+)